MTYGLLTEGAATVLVGDGNWTSGYEIDALACGRNIGATDLCKPVDPPEPDEEGSGYRVVPFGIEGHQKWSVICAPSDNESAMTEAITVASEFIVANTFWSGAIADWKGDEEGLFLEHPDIHTIAPEEKIGRSIASALKEAYTRHPEIQPTVHLGLGSAVDFASDFFVAEESHVKFIVSPGYPMDAVAVTGPVVVRLGSVETLKSYDHRVNREYVQATRIAAVEFDPCLAVRVSSPVE